VKKFIYLSIGAILAGTAWYGAMVSAQAPATAPQPAPQPTTQTMRPRIALVNIAKVLREFKKATADGEILNKKRQSYFEQIKPFRDALALKSRAIQQTVNPDEKARLQKEALDTQRQIEDIERDAQKTLGEMTDRTIVDIYRNIQQIIKLIADANNLDLVMCYPDASKPEDEEKPAVAQLKLQTPALIPFYHRGMDITQVVVDTLNRRFPAPPVPASAYPPASGAPAPMGGVQPANGNVPPKQ